MSEIAAARSHGELAAQMTRGFYARVGWVLLGVGIVGFAPTYWVPMFRGTLEVPPLTHIHALLFYGWLVLFSWQATLVATGRTARHREFGIAGVSIATAMFFVGVATALQTVRMQEAAGFGEASRPFAAVPLLGILLFAILFAMALANVKRPEIHKRFMLVATVSILQAGLARLFILALAPMRPPAGAGPPPPPPIWIPLLPGAVVDLAIIGLMFHDRRTRGRVHPAYWVAGAMVLFVQLIRIPLSGTSAWAATVDWLLALAP